MENKFKRLCSGVILIILVSLFLVGGALAWQDVSQHKTNLFKTTSVKHNVVLVENFNPVLNWKENEYISKQVLVRNGQDTDLVDYVYDDAYIRIQLLEYMALGEQKYIESRERLMVDEYGDFISADTKSSLRLKLESLKVENIDEDRMIKYPSLLSGSQDELYYYQTRASDLNGQYGKFILVDEVVDEFESITHKGNYVYDESSEYHNQISKDKSMFSIHMWDKDGLNYAKESEFTEYVSWSLGADVMTLESWLSAGSPQVSKWILDTSSDEGWVYWGESLKHYTKVQDGSLTSTLLEGVRLDKMPTAQAEYMIHVVMDAVSLEDMNLWDDASDDIKAGISGNGPYMLSREALKKSIDKAESLNVSEDFLEAEVLKQELAVALDVYFNEASTRDDLETARILLDQSIEAYQRIMLKRTLQDLVSEAEALEDHRYTPQTYDNVKVEMDIAKVLIDDVHASLEDLMGSIERLDDALSRLVLVPVSVGDKLEFAGHKWTVLKQEAGMSLVIVDALSKEDLETMNVISSIMDDGSIQYQRSSSNKLPYSSSQLKLVDEAFYRTFIECDDGVLESVQAVSFRDEAMLASSWSMRKGSPTLINSKGQKTAFSLSISDLNYYELDRSYLESDTQSWLRSPGSSNHHLTALRDKGGLYNIEGTDSYNRVRPALWIDLSFLETFER